MAELFKVNAPVRKPLFEGVQGENEARSIQFDITPWVEELGDGAVTATAKRSQDSQPYPVTVTKDGNVVTWKPTSTDTAFAGVGSFQLEYTVDDVLAKTCIWSTMVAPSLDPAGDPPDPYDNWLAEMREIEASAIQAAQDAEQAVEDAQDEVKNAEALAVGQRGGVDVPSTDPAYENNAKYWAEQSLTNQYGAFIVKSASGDIASFNDGGDDVPMKSVNVQIVPKQSGSGDPSPSNVRPITGTSTTNVTVTGTNIWDEVWELGTINGSGVPVASTSKTRSKNFIPCASATVYYLKSVTSCDLFFYDGNESFISGLFSKYDVAFTTPANAKFIKFSNQSTTHDKDISINYPSTDHDYHAYNGHTTPVPLGQTVYGGSVNPISGELVIDRAIVDAGTLNWSKLGTAYITFGSTSLASVIKQNNASATAICNQYKAESSSSASGSADNYVWVNANKLLAIKDTSKADMTVAEFKTAMNGVQICYELANPTTVQLTPTQVATLLSTNNVWADCGSVAVEYRADPTLAYNELANVIVSLGGNL